MATQYTPILQLALPVTGELNGTWGDVVNDNITSMVEEAIAGLATISTWTANSHTLTTADGTTDEARCAMLVAATGTGGTALTGAGQIICPARTKLYVVKNSSSYAVTLKTAAGTGVAVAAGDTAFLFCDGTNVGSCVTQIVNGHITGNLTVDGNTTLGDASGDTVTVNAGTTTFVNANPTLNQGTATRILFLNGSKVIADAAGLTWDGTTMSATRVATSQVNITGQGDLRLEDTTGGEYVALQAPATLSASYTLTMPADDGTNGQALITDGSGNLSWSTAASGDVYGPASATSTAVALFDGTTGKLIKNSGVTIDGSNNVSGVAQLNATTVDLTNLEVTNIKAKDGTQAVAIADSTGALTLSSGVANGVAYLNGSKVLTTGSALTFDGTNLGLGTATPSSYSGWSTITLNGATGGVLDLKSTGTLVGQLLANSTNLQLSTQTNIPIQFLINASEQMRLTSTGLGIGTSSPVASAFLSAGNDAGTASGKYAAFFGRNNGTQGKPTNIWGLSIGWNYSGGGGESNIVWGSGAGTSPDLSFASWDGSTYTDRMRLTSSGNLGLGVTPSAWDSGYRALQVGLYSGLAYEGGKTFVTTNAYNNGTNWIYANSDYASRYQQQGGLHAWYTAPSGTAGNAISFTQAMTLDASGNLIVGATSAGGVGATIYPSGIIRSNTNAAVFAQYQYLSSSMGTINTDGINISYNAQNALTFGTGGTTERMRIDSSGNVGIGTSSPVSNLNIASTTPTVTLTRTDNGTTPAAAINFNATSTVKWQIGTNQSVGPGLEFNAGNGTNNYMYLNTSGNLGIGTSSPAVKLDVSGQGRFLSNTQDQLTVGTTSTSAGASLTITSGNGTTSSKYSYLNFINSQSSTKTWRVGTYGEDNFVIVDGNTERLKLDASGNLGLGVTPSSWTSGYRALDIGSYGTIVTENTSGKQLDLWYNSYYSGAAYYKNNGYASVFRQSSSGQFQWYLAPSGTAGNAISFTQAMTLDASGNLGIGTSSPTGRAGKVLEISSSIEPEVKLTATGSNGNNAFLAFSPTASGNAWITNTQASNSALIFGVGGYTTERMRIDSSGNLLVGTTATSGPSGKGICLSTFDDGGGHKSSCIDIGHEVNVPSGYGFSRFYYNGSQIGSIAQNGTTAVSYNTSSDYRLKENIQPMQNALDVVAQLNPVRYTWKADGSDGQGFIAHELQAVVPDCVTGEKDAVDKDGKPVYQGVDTSFLVATLTAAIKELKAELDATKAEVAALKAN